MRGLKPVIRSLLLILLVASFTDAWIETFCAAMARFWRLVASFTDAWIETTVATRTAAILSRIFYRCVD